MIKFLYRHNKNYSRYNIIKSLVKDLKLKKDIYILMPFSKNQFIKNFFKRDIIVNDFFISNYDTYVYDREKITKYNPRAWWKFFQDWVNFKFSKYLLSDTKKHFEYWEKLFGTFKGKHFVLPVLADKNIYYPSKNLEKNDKLKILFYGSFIPLHGIETILKALKIVEYKNINFEANIIGTGQTYKKMSTLYKELNFKNVKMNGEVIAEELLADEIRSTDIVLGIFGNSKKASSVIPNKVYQALACKKTIITTETGAIKEFFDKDDLLFCDNTPESLSSKIIELSHDTQKIETIAKHGYESFNKLYKTTQKNFISFLKDIK